MQTEALDPKLISTITGDLTLALRNHASDVLRRYPNSVRAYALFNALREISAMYDDEQGVPTSEALEIDQSLLGGILKLLEEGQFQRGELPSEATVEALLVGLARLGAWRKP